MPFPGDGLAQDDSREEGHFIEDVFPAVVLVVIAVLISRWLDARNAIGFNENESTNGV